MEQNAAKKVRGLVSVLVHERISDVAQSPVFFVEGFPFLTLGSTEAARKIINVLRNFDLRVTREGIGSSVSNISRCESTNHWKACNLSL